MFPHIRTKTTRWKNSTKNYRKCHGNNPLTPYMRAFKAKIGEAWQVEKYVGKFGSGKRKKRGDSLITITGTRRLYIRNSLYRKQHGR